MRKRIRLPRKDWGAPLRKLQGELTKLTKDGKIYSLSVAVGDCSRYYRYLKVTWRRLEADYDLYDKYLSLMEEYMGKAERELPRRPIDSSVLDKYLENMTCLRLDYESFFIFGMILMDKLAYTAQLFLGEASSCTVPSSFSKQRKFFSKPKNIPFSPDKEYAEYMREKTGWFEQSLKLPRDKLIVHGLTYVSGIKSSLDGTITLPRMGWGRNLRNVWTKLKDLKHKYEDIYPELKRVSDNIFEFTRFLLNTPNITLESDDRTILLECVRRAGSELPDISIVADNVIGFAEFFSVHFTERARACHKLEIQHEI